MTRSITETRCTRNNRVQSDIHTGQFRIRSKFCHLVQNWEKSRSQMTSAKFHPGLPSILVPDHRDESLLSFVGTHGTDVETLMTLIMTETECTRDKFLRSQSRYLWRFLSICLSEMVNYTSIITIVLKTTMVSREIIGFKCNRISPEYFKWNHRYELDYWRFF